MTFAKTDELRASAEVAPITARHEGDRAPAAKIDGGRRVHGLQKAGSAGKPLLSVITVVRNGAAHVEETIRSVLFQSYENIEFLVVDGGSVDGTVDIIKAYDDQIDYWITEPDRGIYHAMNKGVRLARGNYLTFLNADDHYIHARVVQNVVDVMEQTGSAILIGDTVMLSKSHGTGHIRHSNVSKYYYLFRGIPQQAFFYSAHVFADKQFDEDLKIASDLEFYLFQYLRKSVPVVRVDYPIVVFNTGATSANKALLQQERDLVLGQYFSRWERLAFGNRLMKRFFVANDLVRRRRTVVDKLLEMVTTAGRRPRTVRRNRPPPGQPPSQGP